MTKVIDAAKETIEESFVKPGIKMGTALPRFGAKLMGWNNKKPSRIGSDLGGCSFFR